MKWSISVSYTHLDVYKRQLFTTIALSLDTESQFSFAHTCKTVYDYHKKQYKEQTFTLLCDPNYDIFLVSDKIKTLERHMSQTGWICMKVNLKMEKFNAQNSYEYPVKALCLHKDCLLYTSDKPLRPCGLLHKWLGYN